MMSAHLPDLEVEYSEDSQAISCYSDIDGVIHYNSTAALRRFVTPPSKVDLKEGVSNDVVMRKIARRLDPVIETCLLSPAKHILLHADVITRRGVLTSLCCPQGNDVEFNISFIANKLFLEQNYTSDASPMYLGSFSFEQKCTTPCDNSYARGWYYSVVSRKIGQLSFVFSGEVDCVTDAPGDGIPQPSSFLELKTRLETKKPRYIHLDNRKWYMQSYLLGTSNIFVGYRDKNHVLHRTEMIPIDDLKTNVSCSRRELHFCPRDALHRIDSILRTVLRRVEEYDLPEHGRDHVVWRMTVTPAGRIKELRQLASQEVHALNGGDNERRIGIISERLVNLMQQEEA